MKPRILAAIGILGLICAFWLASRNLSSHHGATTGSNMPTKVRERDPASSSESQRTERSATRKSEWFEKKSTLPGSEDSRSNPRIEPDRNNRSVDRKYPDSSLSKFKRPSSSLPTSNAPPSIHHPAAWVDLGDDLTVPEGFELAIQQEAERLLEELSQSDGDDAARNAAVARSDQLFKQRYGGWLWMQHHVRAHHLGESQSAP